MSTQPAVAAPVAKGSRVWLWIVAAFVLQGLVWVVWINLARQHPVQEVPLVHRR